MSAKLTTQEFISRAISTHGSKYDYSLVNYSGRDNYVDIICPVHGIFKQSPHNHVRKRGCPSCKAILISDMFSSTTSEFIKKAKNIHGDKYDYSKVKYTKCKVNVPIICKIHGLFHQTPSDHINQRSGCPDCAINERKDVQTKTITEFINEAKKIHGNKYRYEFIKYKTAHNKVTIFCLIHGSFEQTPANHLRGKGCRKCADSCKSELMRETLTTFINKAKKTHGNKYRYINIRYSEGKSIALIECRLHGLFEQKCGNHIYGTGCPSCADYGFDRTRPASLYVLRSDCGNYMKIGITHNPKQRYAKLKRDTPFQFECIELIEGQGDQIANLEKQLLAEYQQAEFTETFDGYTEWRLWDDSIRNKLLTSKL